MDDTERLCRDYYPKVNAKLIAVMERLVRAVSLQFTLGGHLLGGPCLYDQRPRVGLPDPHAAGVAILGKSVGPFIEMAHSLGAE